MIEADTRRQEVERGLALKCHKHGEALRRPDWEGQPWSEFIADLTAEEELLLIARTAVDTGADWQTFIGSLSDKAVAHIFNALPGPLRPPKRRPGASQMREIYTQVAPLYRSVPTEALRREIVDDFCKVYPLNPNEVAAALSSLTTAQRHPQQGKGTAPVSFGLVAAKAVERAEGGK